jgi:hypothetical protein
VFEPGEQCVDLRWWHRRDGLVEARAAQDFPICAQPVVTNRRKPHQRSTPVAWIGLTLEQSAAFQPSDDVADNGLGTVEMKRRLAHGQRPRQREMIQHRPRGSGQSVTWAIAAVEREIHSAKQRGESTRLHVRIGHNTTISPAETIVNPDGFKRRDRPSLDGIRSLT